MTFAPVERPTKGVVQNTPAISIGARRRGSKGRLTPYVMLTAEASQALFGGGDGFLLALEIGSGDHAGWIKLVPAEDGVLKLRKASPVKNDLLAESVLIPHDGKTKLRRSAAEFEIDGGLLIKLPWHKDKKKEL